MLPALSSPAMLAVATPISTSARDIAKRYQYRPAIEYAKHYQQPSCLEQDGNIPGTHQAWTENGQGTNVSRAGIHISQRQECKKSRQCVGILYSHKPLKTKAFSPGGVGKPYI